MNDKLIKPPDPSNDPKGVVKSASGSGAIKISGKSRLHSAIAALAAVDPNESFRKAVEDATKSQADKIRDPLTAENRIVIMADCSGSMSESGSKDWSGKTKISLLQEALVGFINQVNFDSTSVAIYTFPFYFERESEDAEDASAPLHQQGIKYKLSFDKTLLTFAAQSLSAGGGTPMHSTMEKVLTELPLTRGIIISDGKADWHDAAIEQARAFAKSETIVDTIHIGLSTGGEELLQEIAQITGGIYIKFDNVAAFAKSFSFLTPEGRATLMLTGGAKGELRDRHEVAKLLGAKEVK